ncbi:MAG: TauD/TfdA family dioxygenase [Deinococcota bacterium]
MNHSVLHPIGTRIDGIDLATLSADDVQDIKALLAEHGAVIFPKQTLDDSAFVTFLRGFGEIAFTEGETSVEGFDNLLNIVSNVGRTRPPRSVFHVDTSYVRCPPAYTALRAVEIPSQGGETLFTNQYRAYETLSEDLRERLAGKLIRHVVSGLNLDSDAETEARHPVFRKHPISGKTALFLSTPERCVGISDIPDDEAREIITHLFDHSTQEDNITRHAWAAGDVVMWDNACVLHRGDHSRVVGDRVMHRGMVAGDVPVAA